LLEGGDPIRIVGARRIQRLILRVIADGVEVVESGCFCPREVFGRRSLKLLPVVLQLRADGWELHAIGRMTHGLLRFTRIARSVPLLAMRPGELGVRLGAARIYVVILGSRVCSTESGPDKPKYE